MSSHAALVCLSETSSHLRKMEPDINTLASYKMMRFPTLDLPWGATTKYIVTQSGQLKCFITVEICTLRATREQNHHGQRNWKLIFSQPPGTKCHGSPSDSGKNAVRVPPKLSEERRAYSVCLDSVRLV